MAAAEDPALARSALDGLAAYARAERPKAATPRPEVARAGPATLRDHGGEGPPAILIPSLINPPSILDLDPEVSLASAISGMGRRALLIDWGEAHLRAGLSVAGHVDELLLPLLRSIDGPSALVGYCLGGTMAIAAANFVPVDRLVTLAAPWRFAAYSEQGRESLGAMWRDTRSTAETLGALPMEVLQAAFWSLDPARTVAKFAKFAGFDPATAEARRFVQLEDWANEGEPLPYPAARELFEDFFAADQPGSEAWMVGGKKVEVPASLPMLHVTAAHDRITPAAAAPPGPAVELATGHVGMVVGSARARLHQELRRFLGPACR